MSAPLRLEVLLPVGWVDLLAPTHTISWNRAAMDASLLTATILDARLDPSEADTLESGRPLRLLTQTTRGWEPVYTGKIANAKVSYPRIGRNVPDAKKARIEIQATDLMQPLGTSVEPRSVATADELRTLLAASGLPYRVNGTTAAGPASPLIVANNPGSFLADQVVITRDTLTGYAWVANDGVLDFYEPLAMPTDPVATFSDAARAVLSYSTIDASYDSADVIDEVQVDFLRYKTVADATESISYGPYRRPGATGTNAKQFTIVGAVEDEARIEAFAQAVLDRNAVAQVRPTGLTTPVRSLDEREAAARLEPCSLVRVGYDGRLDVLVRVETVEHTIVANPDEAHRFPGGAVWTSSYTFTAPESVARPQRTSILRAAPVLDRLEDTEFVAASASVSAGVAQFAAAEAKVTAQSAEDRGTGMKAAEPQTSVSGPRVRMRSLGGRGVLEFIGETMTAFISAVVEDARQTLVISTGGGDASARIRMRSDSTSRDVDFLGDNVNAFGVLNAKSGLTLPNGPQVMRGANGGTGIARTTSSEGTTQVVHGLSGGGVVFGAPQPGGSAEPTALSPTSYDLVRGSVTGSGSGSLVTFQVVWRPGVSGQQAGSPVVNQRIVFGYAILNFDA